MVEQKAEEDILRRLTRTSSHTARQHRGNVGAPVARLPNDLEMEYIKLEVFGVEGGPGADHGEGAPGVARALQDMRQ